MARRTRSVVGVVALTVLAVVGWYAARPHPCRATFARVAVGMTRDEVYATVGGPPGWYVTDAGGWYDGKHFDDDRDREQWAANDGCLFVAFGNDGVAETVDHFARLRSFP